MWLVYAFSAAVLWGLSYALAEKILAFISPVTLLALEMLLGGLIFFVIALHHQFKTDLPTLIHQPKIGFLFLAEIIVVLTANYLIVTSIQAKNATVAGIIELIYPLFTILFTALLFKENHVNTQVIIGGFLILFGVLVIGFA